MIRNGLLFGLVIAGFATAVNRPWDSCASSESCSVLGASLGEMSMSCCASDAEDEGVVAPAAGASLSSNSTLASMTLPAAHFADGEPAQSEEPKASDEDEEKKDEKEEEKKEEKKVEIIPGTGIIEGVIRLKGDAPKFEGDNAFTIPKNNADHAKCVDHVKDERLIVGEEAVLANAVVFVEDWSFRPPKRPKPEEIELSNEHCLFKPHVLATTVGSKLELTNADGFIHNTRGLLATDGINVAVPPKGKVRPKTLRRPGWGVMKCDFHPWMTAHVHVFAHPFYDVSEKDGKFRIVNVPPGKYKLQLWHEVLENRTIEVTVEADETVEIDEGLEAYKD